MMVRQNHKYKSKRQRMEIRLRQAPKPRSKDPLLRVARLVKKAKTERCLKSTTRKRKMT